MLDDIKYKKFISDCHKIPIIDQNINCADKFTLRVIVHESNYGADRKKFLYCIFCCDNFSESPYYHPFKHIKLDKDEKDYFAEIIADNQLVRLLLDYIIMADSDLENFSGSTDVLEYRSKLISFVDTLWD